MSGEQERKVLYKGEFVTVEELRERMPIKTVSMSQRKILKALLDADRPITPKELSQKTGIPLGYLYTALKKMPAEYIVKIGKKRFLVGLTEEGVKKAEE